MGSPRVGPPGFILARPGARIPVYYRVWGRGWTAAQAAGRCSGSQGWPPWGAGPRPEEADQTGLLLPASLHRPLWDSPAKEVFPRGGPRGGTGLHPWGQPGPAGVGGGCGGVCGHQPGCRPL